MHYCTMPSTAISASVNAVCCCSIGHHSVLGQQWCHHHCGLSMLLPSLLVDCYFSFPPCFWIVLSTNAEQHLCCWLAVIAMASFAAAYVAATYVAAAYTAVTYVAATYVAATSIAATPVAVTSVASASTTSTSANFAAATFAAMAFCSLLVSVAVATRFFLSLPVGCSSCEHQLLCCAILAQPYCPPTMISAPECMLLVLLLVLLMTLHTHQMGGHTDHLTLYNKMIDAIWSMQTLYLYGALVPGTRYW